MGEEPCVSYRMVYFRIYTNGYVSGWASDADRAAFREETRRLFQELEWTLQPGGSGVCDTVTKDRQDLYLHPTSFSGVMEEDNIQSLQEQLSAAQTFRCYAVNRYKEYQDMSDEEYQAALEEKRSEITAFTLEQCKTKRANLYITDPVAPHIAEHFEICRLCDRDRHNAVGIRFVSELMNQLLQKGRLVAAETTHGVGIRTATAKELGRQRQPVEQVDGQVSMALYGEAKDVNAPSKQKKVKNRNRDR